LIFVFARRRHAAGELSLALARCDEVSLHSIGFIENPSRFFASQNGTSPAGGKGCETPRRLQRRSYTQHIQHPSGGGPWPWP